MPDLETPDEDAAEQQQTVVDPDEVVSADASALGDSTVEADEGDLAESAREVPLDEDDWR